MKILFGAIAALLVTSSAVNAGEYAAKPDRWSGCYGGVNTGYMGGQSKLDWVAPSGLASTPTYYYYEEKYTPKGSISGIHIGCAQQISKWVVGLEFEGSYSFANERVKNVSVYNNGYTNSEDNKWVNNGLGSLRVRGGYALGNFLPFVTLGISGVSQAYTESGLLTFQNLGIVNIAGSYKSTTRLVNFGSSVGAGMEYALSDHWSAKAEYTFISLAKTNMWDGDAKNSSTIHMARVGASYKF